MKRPPEKWLLPILGILLFLHTTHCLRATALIFAKTTTTTTTSTEAPPQDESRDSVEDSQTLQEQPSDGSNTNETSPQLTGIPQKDYIWDPNLPRELNGFNLTDYPFYEVIPKDIDFKCDGLHDGFYASVPHKCQVYHHCLFGTRYDFLCANYTAFDQKTFICHFVSEVDCANSHKYWHRNDALYKAATTTTLAPITIRTTTTIAPEPAVPRRPVSSNSGRRRRPFRRRRPQYDYYDEYDEYETDRAREDEYYDEPRYQATEAPKTNGRRRKRPRPVNRRPEYDAYEEYEEDERYNRRGTGRRDEERRRPAKKDQRYDDEPLYEDEEPVDRRRPGKNSGRKTRPIDDDYERRPNRKTSGRRPIDDDRYDDKEDRRSYDRRKEDDVRRRPDYEKDDRRTPDRRRTEDDERKYRPRDEERPYKPTKKEDEPEKGLVRPSSGSSIYDKPRAPPIIRRPVPKSEKDKYDYKPMAQETKTKPVIQPEEDEEYYEDYEEEVPKPKPTTTTTTTTPKPTRKEEPERRYKPKRNYRPQKSETESTRPTRRPSEDPEDLRRPLKDIDDTRRKLYDRKPKPEPEEDDTYRPKRPSYQEDRFNKRPTSLGIPESVDSDDSNRRPLTPKRPLKRPDDLEDIRRPLFDDRRPLKRPEILERPIDQEDRRLYKKPDDSSYPRTSQSQSSSGEDTREQKRPEVLEERRPFKRPEPTVDVRRPVLKESYDDRKEDISRPSYSDERRKRPIDTSEVSETFEVKRPQLVAQKRPVDDFEERRPVKRPESVERGKTKYENRFEPAKQQPQSSKEYDDYEESKEDYRDSSREEIPTLQRPSKFAPKPKDEQKPEIKIDPKDLSNREPIVRIVKRPFLPSRGGNPYVGRGLLPVGTKAQTQDKMEQNDSPVNPEPQPSQKKANEFLMKTSSEEYYEESEEQSALPVHKTLPKEDPTIEDIFKPVTTRPKMDFRQHFRSEQPSFIRPTAEIKTSTQKIETETVKNPLDINENEYDVTLNDALNPTIPNLPIRNVPTGFGAGSDLVNSYKKALSSRNYQYNQPYQRPRFVAIEAPLNPSGSEYIYRQVKGPERKLQQASSNPSYTYVSAPLAYHNSYQQQVTGQYYTLG